MVAFSANLGFLWAELALPDAIAAAARAGFGAVECHWPYDVDPGDVKAALAQHGLGMVCLNTKRGDHRAGEFGLSALVGRKADARAAIDQAIDYAAAVGARAVHVMAGIADGDQARAVFMDNLRYGLRRAAPHGITLLIEPINRGDVPGYFLCSADQGAAIIREIASPYLRLMFDCYHLETIHGDVTGLLDRLIAIIGHIQIAAVPGRGEPDGGALNYRPLLKLIDDLGYGGFVGAEYRPRAGTDAGLGWMKILG